MLDWHAGLYVDIPHALSRSQNLNTQRQCSIHRSEEHHDGFDVIELEPEEAYDFGLITNLEIVSYR